MCNGQEYCRRERAFRASLQDTRPAADPAEATRRHGAKVKGAETVATTTTARAGVAEQAWVREQERERRQRPREAEAEIERTEKLMHLILWGPN